MDGGATFDDAGFRQRSPEPEPMAATVASEDTGMRDATPVALEDVGGEVVDSIIISHDDARFLIGSRGSTKAKLAKVSGARLEVSAVDSNAENGNQRLDIKGSAAARAKAKRYCEWVLRQRVGTIVVDTSTQSDDVTIMDVPASCTAYITGHAGSGLRRIEENNSSLMFFGKPTTDPEDAPEKLIICGSRKARRGSELSVMSSVERRDPGTYVGEDGKLKVKFDQPGDGLNDGWGFDVFPFANDEEVKFAVGAQGNTRKKVAAASGCSFEYVGMLGVMAGIQEARMRCWDYIKWIMKQMKGTLHEHLAYKDRSDVTVMHVKSGHGGISRVYGKNGDTLREIEKRTATCVFNIPDLETPGSELLCIYSHDADARDRAKRAVENVLVHGLPFPEDRQQNNNNGKRGDRGGNKGGGGQKQRCYDFSVGRCTRGDRCRWAHVVPDGNQRGGGPDRGGGGPDRRNRRGGREAKPYARPSEKWGAGANRAKPETMDLRYTISEQM